MKNGQSSSKISIIFKKIGRLFRVIKCLALIMSTFDISSIIFLVHVLVIHLPFFKKNRNFFFLYRIHIKLFSHVINFLFFSQRQVFRSWSNRSLRPFKQNDWTKSVFGFEPGLLLILLKWSDNRCLQDNWEVKAIFILPYVFHLPKNCYYTWIQRF